MYFSSLKLFEVLKFFQFLMLFENQFLDTSSNFGAPKKKAKTWQRARFTVRLFLPLMCLTSVFGMGTGVTTSLSSPDLYF